jgi:tryptophanyl-tRNA synthetase
MKIRFRQKLRLRAVKAAAPPGLERPVKVNQSLSRVLNDFLRPIRDKRSGFARDPEAVMTMLKEGAARGRDVVSSVLTEVKRAMRLDYY